MEFLTFRRQKIIGINRILNLRLFFFSRSLPLPSSSATAASALLGGLTGILTSVLTSILASFLVGSVVVTTVGVVVVTTIVVVTAAVSDGELSITC